MLGPSNQPNAVRQTQRLVVNQNGNNSPCLSLTMLQYSGYDPNLSIFVSARGSRWSSACRDSDRAVTVLAAVAEASVRADTEGGWGRGCELWRGMRDNLGHHKQQPRCFIAQCYMIDNVPAFCFISLSLSCQTWNRWLQMYDHLRLGTG